MCYVLHFTHLALCAIVGLFELEGGDFGNFSQEYKPFSQTLNGELIYTYRLSGSSY